MQSVSSIAHHGNQQFGLGYESTVGTAVAPSVLLPVWGDFEIDDLASHFDRSPMTNRLDPIAPGVKWDRVEGVGVDVLTDCTALPYWLQVMFGPPTAGVYSLPTVADGLRSATVYRLMPDISTAVRYTGVHLSHWSLSLDQEAYCMSRFGMVARSESIVTPSWTPTKVNPVSPFGRDGNTVSLGGATTALTTATNFMFNFNPVRDQYPISGGAFATRYMAGVRHFYGRLGILCDPTYAAAQYAIAVAKTAQTCVVTLAVGATTMVLDLGNIYLQRPRFRKRGDGYIAMDFAWTAGRPTSSDHLLTVTVTP